MTAVTDNAHVKHANQQMQGLRTSLSLLLLGAAAVFYAKWVPVTVSASLPATAFSADRAMRHVGQLAARPHPTGSAPNAAVRAYLLDELKLLGLTPQVQTATGVGTLYAVAGRVNNVLVRVPGKQPSGLAVVLMAHYDGVPAAPGAGDDASGSAVLLETLRALRSGPPLAHDVIALFTDGEEPGLIGAAAFVSEHPWSKDVGVVLNFEARGTRGPSLMFETGPGNLDVVRVLRGVRGVRATSLSTAVYRTLPNDTDLSELAVLEPPALNFAFIGGADRYHSAQDDAEHLDARSVQHHGDQALALARAFGNGPLPRPRTSDGVFFDLPLLGLVVYPESWALPLAVLALVLVVAVIVRLRTSEPRWVRDVVLGALGPLAAILLAGAAGYAASAALQRLHGALESGTPEWSGLYAVAVAMLSIAIASASYAVVRRWASPSGAHSGALLVWALLSVYVAVSVPGVSFLLTWPLIAVAAATVAGIGRPNALVSQVLLWIGTLVAVFVLVPIVYIMACTALGLSETGGVVLSVFTALGAWLLAPHLESLGSEGRGWTPAIGAGAALVFFATGAATVRTTLRHPTGASLVYALDADSSGAWLSGYGWSAGARSALRRVLGEVSASSSTPPPAWLRRSFEARSIVTVPVVELASPAATVLSDSTAGSERYVTLHIRAAPGTRAISMATDSGVVLSAQVDQKAVLTNRYRVRPRRWALQYTAPPDSGFTLWLTLRATSHPVVGITAISEGIPPLPGVRLPRRPPGILPVQGGDVTWVYYRVQL